MSPSQMVHDRPNEVLHVRVYIRVSICVRSFVRDHVCLIMFACSCARVPVRVFKLFICVRSRVRVLVRVYSCVGTTNLYRTNRKRIA